MCVWYTYMSRHACAIVYMWSSGDNFWDLVLFFHPGFQQELNSSCWICTVFTCWAISLALSATTFVFNYICIWKWSYKVTSFHMGFSYLLHFSWYPLSSFLPSLPFSHTSFDPIIPFSNLSYYLSPPFLKFLQPLPHPRSLVGSFFVCAPGGWGCAIDRKSVV